MKIQLLSDLHCEFANHPHQDTDADVVVLAGDIHIKGRGLKWAIENIKDKPVIYVLGNHEFYGKAHPKLITQMKILAEGTNVHILEKETLTIDGINFLGCTLWTDFELFGDPRIAGYECQQVMTDYKKIKKYPQYSKVRSLDIAIINKHSTHWLTKELEAKSGQANIVVTHHGPSIKSVPECSIEDIVTAAYVSDLEAFIQKYQPSHWLHGHLHCSSDYKIGACRVICNPKGYPGEGNDEFDPRLCFEVREK